MTTIAIEFIIVAKLSVLLQLLFLSIFIYFFRKNAQTIGKIPLQDQIRLLLLGRNYHFHAK